MSVDKTRHRRRGCVKTSRLHVTVESASLNIQNMFEKGVWVNNNEGLKENTYSSEALAYGEGKMSRNSDT